ncbi:hypothetical protein ACA910_020460 [Epithemia clementina (nom. ined.)]
MALKTVDQEAENLDCQERNLNQERNEEADLLDSDSDESNNDNHPEGDHQEDNDEEENDDENGPDDQDDEGDGEDEMNSENEGSSSGENEILYRIQTETWRTETEDKNPDNGVTRVTKMERTRSGLHPIMCTHKKRRYKIAMKKLKNGESEKIAKYAIKMNTVAKPWWVKEPQSENEIRNELMQRRVVLQELMDRQRQALEC